MVNLTYEYKIALIEILLFLLDLFYIFSGYLFLDQDFRIGYFESSLSNFCHVVNVPYL